MTTYGCVVLNNVLGGTNRAGFTVVEFIIAIFVAATMMLSFITLQNANSLSLAQTQQQASAYSLAYSNLRYDTVGSTYYRSMYPCGSSNDLSANPSAAGSLAQNQTPSGVALPSPVTTTLTIYYPKGCVASGSPMLFVRVVTWGPQNYTIKASQYVL